MPRLDLKGLVPAAAGAGEVDLEVSSVSSSEVEGLDDEGEGAEADCASTAGDGAGSEAFSSVVEEGDVEPALDESLEESSEDSSF